MKLEEQVPHSQDAVVVPLEVQGEVVGAGEGPLAHPALERPVPRVLPHVPRQLVGAGKLPAAVLPRADVRLLARVRPEVRLQVGGLGVALAAAGVVAGVRGKLPLQAVQLGLRLRGSFFGFKFSSHANLTTSSGKIHFLKF